MAGIDLMATGSLRDRLERALMLDGHAEYVHRLTIAETSVAFRTTGPDPQAVTLLLDRDVPTVVDGDDAEVTITFGPEVAEDFGRGRLVLATALLAGDATGTGEVRRYLSVDPILRGLLCTLDGGHPFLREPRRGAVTRSPDGIECRDGLFAIETAGLRKAFGSNQVLRGADIQIPAGCISTVLGPSGTGKSVLIKHVLGLLQPDAGDVLVHGRSLTSMSHSEILMLRRGIGVMFQDGALFSSMSVYDNVAFPLRQHTDYNEVEVRETVLEHLEAVGLADAAQRFPRELSGGMRKRAGLARALVLDPGIVMCDEPDSGLDPVRTRLLGELLLQRQHELGGTMVVVTHNIALARAISDHISVLWRGRIVDSGPADELWESEDPFVRQFLAGGVEGPLGMDA